MGLVDRQVLTLGSDNRAFKLQRLTRPVVSAATAERHRL